MNYETKQGEKRTAAGLHLVGPWEQTVKKSFEQLMMWVDNENIVPKERAAVYYDNPGETPIEKLRCDTVVTVPGYFTLPENSEGAILTEITGDQCAMAVARVAGDDFVEPWYQFFNSLLQGSAHEMLPKPCFEVYLNNGTGGGYWDIEMYVAAQPKHHQFISRRCVSAITTLLLKSEKSKVRLSIPSLLPGDYTVPGLLVG